MTPSPLPYRPEPGTDRTLPGNAAGTNGANAPVAGVGGSGTDVPIPDVPTPDVPTLEEVRDRIEGRYATALGGAELAAESAEGRDRARAEQDRERAAAAALERIRASLRPADGRP